MILTLTNDQLVVAATEDNYACYLKDLLHDFQAKGLLGVEGEKVRTGYQATGLALRHQTPEEIIGAMYDLGNLRAEDKKALSIMSVLPADRIPYPELAKLLPEKTKLEADMRSLATRGWLELQIGNKKVSNFKISPVIQGIVQEKYSGLMADCEDLINGLQIRLETEGGVHHLIHTSYEEAALFARYAENILEHHLKAYFTL